MAVTPLSAYDVFSAVCTATTANVPPAGYCVTTGSDGIETATTTLLGTSVTGLVDGIALTAGTITKPIQVQREGRVDKSLLTWLGAGSIEPLVADSTGKPQRASVATGLQIGIVDKQGNAYLDLTLQTATAGSGTTYAASLAGLLYIFKRLGNLSAGIAQCPGNAGVSAQMGGTAGHLYTVTLRFRGAVECTVYNGGTNVDTNVNHAAARIVQGGAPDPAVYTNTANRYRFEVSDPSNYWWLNSNRNGSGNIRELDQNLAVSIYGGAWVRLIGVADYDFVIDQPAGVSPGTEQRNDSGSSNTPVSLTDSSGLNSQVSSQPFDGQFVQMDVVSVA